MRAASLSHAPAAGPLRSKRVLALAGDERLVEQIRAGNEAAFEVAFERYGAPILGFCRHMLGSQQEAEDAVQHSFAAAYRALLEDERPIRLKPWLFTIARNRCLTMLRARREQPVEEQEIATEGLAEQVQRRADLRELLRDVADLPDEQRAALLLAELGGLSHVDVAEVIGCEVHRVKALVFRARSGLIERRDARGTPCDAIREQLANLRGGSLRRSELRHHLRVCDGCREYREQVRRQRVQLAAALPVTPSLGLKSSLLSTLGIGGGSAGGGGALVGAAAAGPLVSTAAKVACVAVVAGAGAVAGQGALSQPDAVRAPAAPGHEAPAVPGAEASPAGARAATERAAARRRARVRKDKRTRRSRASRAAKRKQKTRAAAGAKGTGKGLKPKAQAPARERSGDASKPVMRIKVPASEPAPQVRPERVERLSSPAKPRSDGEQLAPPATEALPADGE